MLFLLLLAGISTSEMSLVSDVILNCMQSTCYMWRFEPISQAHDRFPQNVKAMKLNFEFF